MNTGAHRGTRLVEDEYRDIVVFSSGKARFKAKTVILDNPVLQDVFVYPL